MSEVLVKLGFWKRLTGAQFARVGELQTWTQVEAAPRFNQPGAWSVQAPYDRQASLLEKGQLVTIDVARPEGGFWRPMTGIYEAGGPRAAETGEVAFEASGPDVLAVLGGVLNYQVPTAAATAQTDASHYTASGPAETVLRNLVVAQALTRLGMPFTVPASLGRGANVSLKERMSVLLTTLQEKAELAGLGFRMGLVNTTSSTRAELRLEFYEPADRSAYVRLSHRVGSLRTWSQNDQAPTATRAVVMGGGQLTARTYRLRQQLAAEAEWGGWPREVAIDARDTTVAAELDERGDAALLEGASQSSFDLEAVASKGMRFGRDYQLGDMVAVELMTGLEATDRLRSASVSAGTDGLTVKLVPGNPDSAGGDGPVAVLFKQAAIIAELRKQLKALQREES